MLATVRTTVLPAFSVDVYPLTDEAHVSHQRYVLVLRDETAGTRELPRIRLSMVTSRNLVEPLNPYIKRNTFYRRGTFNL
jgi:hypothetical protein